MKINKLINILLIICTIMMCFMPIVNASINPDNYKPNLNDNDFSENGKPVKFAQTIMSVITTVGIVIAVITIIFMGIKFMMGSLEEKAEYKKMMLPYLIGAIFLFGASTIVKIIFSMVKDL